MGLVPRKLTRLVQTSNILLASPFDWFNVKLLEGFLFSIMNIDMEPCWQ